MTPTFESHLKHHVESLVRLQSNLAPIQKKLNKTIVLQPLPYEDLVYLREMLLDLEVQVTMLAKEHDMHLEEEKTRPKRRFSPFKK